MHAWGFIVCSSWYLFLFLFLLLSYFYTYYIIHSILNLPASFGICSINPSFARVCICMYADALEVWMLLQLLLLLPLGWHQVNWLLVKPPRPLALLLALASLVLPRVSPRLQASYVLWLAHYPFAASNIVTLPSSLKKINLAYRERVKWT
jgi:hypothetical protein